MKLYSVTQSVFPYETTEVLSHELPYDDAKKLMDSIRTRIVSLVPSDDLEI